MTEPSCPKCKVQMQTTNRLKNVRGTITIVYQCPSCSISIGREKNVEEK